MWPEFRSFQSNRLTKVSLQKAFPAAVRWEGGPAEFMDKLPFGKLTGMSSKLRSRRHRFQCARANSRMYGNAIHLDRRGGPLVSESVAPQRHPAQHGTPCLDLTLPDRFQLYPAQSPNSTFTEKRSPLHVVPAASDARAPRAMPDVASRSWSGNNPKRFEI